jgi:Flp pilus assembly protein TadG
MFAHRKIRRSRASGKNFFSDRRGTSAVEFALILPVMLVIYLGGFEITQALAVNRLVALTSGTVTNIVSQYSSISASSQMPDILNASVQVLAPYPSSNATVVVSCIAVNNSGVATVSWSQSLNGTARTVGQVVTLPSGLDTPNSTVVLGETTYAYTPLLDYIKLGTINLYSAVYMLPRASTTINLDS